MNDRQLTENESIAFHESGVWRDWGSYEIVRFQLFQDRLAIPFGVFHKAVEDVLDRPVFTHEFRSSNLDSLIEEFLGLRPAPSLTEIMDMIPEDIRIAIMATEEG